MGDFLLMVGDRRGLGRIAVLAGLLTACATARARPDVHETRWLLLETEHIALWTDLEDDEAPWRASGLEQYWQALASMYGVVVPDARVPAGRFAVIHFRRCDDLQRIVGRAAGFGFRAELWWDGPIAVTCEEEDESSVLHELAHVFNGHYFARTPPWVEEGLATYFETLKVRNGRVVVGDLHPDRYHHWKQARGLPGIDELRRMDREQFHDDRGESANYFSAWKLVHLLNGTGPDRQRRFRGYLAALARGVASERAWGDAFGGAPAEALVEDYEAYHRRARVNGWSRLYEWSEPVAPRVRRLRAGEAHVLWLNLLARKADSWSAVAEQLEALAAADPEWPELLYWRAVLRQPPDAGLLRRYLSRRPGDGRGWRALVGIEMAAALPSGYIGLDGAPPPALAAMQRDVLQLIQRASDASSLDTIGRYFAMLQKPTTGLNFAVRAVRANPACASCWDTAALLYFQAGKSSEALAAQERAAGLYAEQAPPDVLARLRRFRTAAAAAAK